MTRLQDSAAPPVRATRAKGDGGPSERAHQLLARSGSVLEVIVARPTSVDRVLKAATPGNGMLLHIGDYETTVCWHDTEDLRLTRAGLTLRSTSEDGENVWALTEHADATAHLQPVAADTHMAADLPDGRLRWRVEDVVGLKPLVVQLEATVQVTLHRVLDELEKTVAILTIESAAGTGGARWISVRVQSMRGFDSELRKILRKLERLDGVAILDRPVLKAVGRADRPKTRTKQKLRRDSSARAGFIQAMRPVAEEIRGLVAPTLADLDPEFLHDLRVNVRRTRSALRIAEGALRNDEVRNFSMGFSWLGEVTGPQRELDVYIESVPSLAKELPAKDTKSLTPFYELLTVEREREHSILQQHLRSPRLEHLLATWERLLTDKSEHPRDEAPSMRLDHFADARLSEVLAEMLKQGSSITAASKPEALHDLRKLGKRMRYTLDLFGSIYPARQLAALSAELKSLQEYLGEYQDVCDQRDGLVRFAHAVRANDGPTSTILAMGQIAAVLGQRADKARADYAVRYTSFQSVALDSQFAPAQGVSA